MSTDGAALPLHIDFGREICGDLAAASSREWLVTNGIGGFASGTIAGVLSRRYHGLLIAALSPPLGRTLLCTKVEETADYGGSSFALSCNRWRSGAVSPEGYRFMQGFTLEGTTPVFTFALADALLEKRIFMRRGENTTYVLYRLCRGGGPLHLGIKVLANYRDYHGTTRVRNQDDWCMQVDALRNGLRVSAFPEAKPYYILSDRADASPRADWYHDFALSLEQERGFEGYEDHLCAGVFSVTLLPGSSLTLVCSTEANADLDGERAYAERQRDEQALIVRAQIAKANESPALKQLILAADQFLVARTGSGNLSGTTILAGYPWFCDWGRDTMISLEGLTLCTGRPELARSILRTFAGFVDRGMLPNHFLDVAPPAGAASQGHDRGDEGSASYNTADATLYYFEALRAYHAATSDDDLLRELYPLLQEILEWHERGTRHGIHVDDDGLLYAGEPGVQLTWMDAKVGDWVVTPRQGKPVEINALFYNALCVLADFAARLQRPIDSDSYQARAAKVRQSFARFFAPHAGYCFDVLDGPEPGKRDDLSLRPNQLLAVSLPHSPLLPEQQKAVVDTCAQHLVTSHGLRSLSPNDPGYKGRYDGDARKRDSAYHQGAAWGWLIGPFVIAHYRVYGDAELARSYLLPLLHHLAAAGLGSISEIFDGEPPHAPRGCIAQAWSVAEWLRAYYHLSPSRPSTPFGQ